MKPELYLKLISWMAEVRNEELPIQSGLSQIIHQLRASLPPPPQKVIAHISQVEVPHLATYFRIALETNKKMRWFT